MLKTCVHIIFRRTCQFFLKGNHHHTDCSTILSPEFYRKTPVTKTLSDMRVMTGETGTGRQNLAAITGYGSFFTPRQVRSGQGHNQL
jgi:hypothetical protein